MKRSAFISATALLMAALLSACQGASAPGTPDNTDTTNTTAPTAQITDTAAETEPEPAASFDVPDSLDYAKREFVILACDENVRYTYIEDAEETGDVMDSAIYRRNLMTEEYLNIDLKVENVKGTDTYTPVSKDVMSNNRHYDMISPHILKSISQLVTSQYVCDLGTLKYIDFTKPWWNQLFTDTLSIKGKLFYASGDIIAPNARVIVFNKQMMEEYQLPDIYADVKDGKWTLDRLGYYVKDANRDLNGNSVLDEGDAYAFADLSNSGTATSFVHASGELFVTQGENGFTLMVSEHSEKMHSIATKLWDYLYQERSQSATNQVFGEGRVLFGSQVLLKLQILRSYQTDFGIIPFPKYDEAQEDYYSSVWNGLVCVPVSAKDADLSGAVLETMAYYSSSTLAPAYYETLLGGKFVRDDISNEMLDIIFDGLVYDVGLCFDNFIGYYSSIGNLLKSGSTDIVSTYLKKNKLYEAHYNKIFEAVK